MNRKLSIPVLSKVNWPAVISVLRKWLPSRGNVIFTLLVVTSLVWAAKAGALPLSSPLSSGTSTNAMAYQGRLANSGGTPLTGTYSMIFRLYSAATGGVPLWEEQWTGPNSVKVSDGLFNVMLGNITSVPQSVVTGNNTLWLGITVGTDDEMSPRVQLGSVPFAVQALTVPDGSVTTAKVADSAITSAKIADGSVAAVDLAGNAVTTAKIADGNVTTADVADSAVTTAKIADGNVTTADVADSAVTTAKIADGNVTTVDVADSAITTAKITDGNVTTADLADNSITTAKIADGAVTSSKQTITSYHGENNTFIRLQGLTEVTLGEFQLENIPAGDVEVIATVMGHVETGASNGGIIRIDANGTDLDNIPTQMFNTDYDGQVTLHGRFLGFTGGTLIVRIKAASENAQVNIRFGAGNGDRRFGRRITIVAGQ